MDELDCLLIMEEKGSVSKDDLEKLELLALHKNKEVRNRTAIVLGLINNKKSEDILLRLLKDKDYLVRANACDSLSNSHDESIIPILFKYINDPSELVRGYAILCITDIVNSIGLSSKDIIDKLEDMMKKEKKEWVLLAYYRALYMLGNKRFLSYLINGLNSADYKVQIFSINTLKELKNDSNYVEINSALLDRLAKSDPISVKDALNKALER